MRKSKKPRLRKKHEDSDRRYDISCGIRTQACKDHEKAQAFFLAKRREADLAYMELARVHLRWVGSCEVNDELWLTRVKAFAAYQATWED